MGDVLESGSWAARIERGPDGLRVRSPADPFLEVLARTKRRWDRLMLATLALRKDPDCIEAQMVLARATDDLVTRILRLNIAVEAGDALWRASGVRCALGGDYNSTRAVLPWFQAYRELGEALEEDGDLEGAREAYSRLLEVDTDDRMGVRDRLELLEAPLAFRC